MDDDRLGEVLDLLERGLDHPGWRGEELAASAYVSRFHLDRIARAAVGEPLGALRRRLLLERAAHHLTTTSETVLEIAGRAGYASPEGFTRAFHRAFGVPPRAFRARRGADHEIAAPSGIHFHAPGGLRAPAPDKEPAMDVLTAMYRHHLATTEAILERLDRVPVEALDAPIHSSVEGIDEEPTLRSVATRLVTQLEMWVGVVRGGTTAPPAGDQGPAALRARLAAVAPAFDETVAAPVAAGSGGTTFVDAMCEPPRTFTLGGVLAHVLTFAAVRRTTAIGALAAAGVDDLGSGDPMVAVGGEGEDASRIVRRS